MRRDGVVSACSWSFLQLPLLTLSTFLLTTPLQVNADGLYSIQNLGSLGSGNALPAGINSSGVAVGYTTDFQGNTIPTTFTGTINSLPGIGEANGINSAGTVVGTTYLNNAPSVTEWSNGQATNLGVSGYGTAINSAGQIAGGVETPNGQLHAFVWTNGNLVDLGTLPGATWASAYGINSSGQVVGTSSGGGRSAAFVSNGNTLTRVAGSLGGANSYGIAINDNGVVVGNAQNAQGYLNAFESTGQGMVNLGTLGGSQSYAYGINDAGTVVGYSFLAGNTTVNAFAYLGGVLIDLNTLLPANSGWTINAAYGINNSGDIVGVGSFNNQLYAVELLPSEINGPLALVLDAPDDPLSTPEPAARLLTGAGVLVLGMLFWRRAKTKPLAE